MGAHSLNPHHLRVKSLIDSISGNSQWGTLQAPSWPSFMTNNVWPSLYIQDVLAHLSSQSSTAILGELKMHPIRTLTLGHLILEWFEVMISRLLEG